MLQVIGLEWTQVLRSQRAPAALDRRLPLAEDGVVHQVGRSVHAAEGVVDRLVSHRYQSVVGHNGVKEDVLGVFAGHELRRIPERRIFKMDVVNQNLKSSPSTSTEPERLTSDSVPQYEWFLGVRSEMMKR